jgi:hypothetical protein
MLRGELEGLPIARRAACKGNHNDTASGHDLEHPRVREGSDLDTRPGLLSELTHERVVQLLARLQLPTGEFPLTPIVEPKQNAIPIQEDALD